MMASPVRAMVKSPEAWASCPDWAARGAEMVNDRDAARSRLRGVLIGVSRAGARRMNEVRGCAFAWTAPRMVQCIAWGPAGTPAGSRGSGRVVECELPPGKPRCRTPHRQRSHLHEGDEMTFHRLRRWAWVQVTAAVALACAWPSTAAAQGDAARMEAAVANLEWRNIGPTIMGGRISDLAVVESDPSTFYVGTATGGRVEDR